MAKRKPEKPEVVTQSAVKKPALNYLALTDDQLATSLKCKPIEVKKLRKSGGPVSEDGTWNVFRVFGHFCRMAKRRRKE